MSGFTSQQRRGLSLVEFMIAMAIVSVLIVGMGAAVSTSMRTTELGARGPSARTAESARILEQIAADLRLALRFTSPLSEHEIEFTVPDRDGDDLPERITWTWSGAPEYTLTREEWSSTEDTTLSPLVVAEDVRDFDLAYITRTWGPPAQTPALVSGEQLLIAHDDAPEGDGTRALLVTTNAGSPTAMELTREGMLNWWGFTVTRIGASEPPEAFLDAVGVNDVAYVPGTIDAGVLASKLANAPIGVVSEHAELFDEFGFAGMPGLPPAVSILGIVTRAHYITSALESQSASVFTSEQPTVALPGDAADRAPGARDLGAWASAPALSVIEPGARLYGTGGTGTWGDDTVLAHATADDDFEQKHVATRIAVTTACAIQSISAHLEFDRDRRIRFGVYADDGAEGGGEPGTLLAETNAVEFEEETEGWCTIPLDAELVLPPGTYWLAIGMQKDVTLRFDHTGGEARFGDSGTNPRHGLMSSWSDTYGPNPNERRFSLFANYTEASFAPGRRVALPWGAANTDVTALTDDGTALMQRSVEWAGDTSPGDPSVDAVVGDHLWVAQYFRPALPTNASSWGITSVLVAIRADPAEPNGTVRFELRHPDASFAPGVGIIDQTAEIPNATWDTGDFTWYEIPFTSVTNLNPTLGVCLVLRGKKDTDAFIKLDAASGDPADTHFMTSLDDGNTWSPPQGPDDMRFYVFGTYSTQGDPVW